MRVMAHPCYGENLKFTMEEWQNILHNKLPELYRVVIDLGGTISGEHGIGHKRREYADGDRAGAD